jgi:hypothetical protein
VIVSIIVFLFLLRVLSKDVIVPIFSSNFMDTPYLPTFIMVQTIIFDFLDLVTCIFILVMLYDYTRKGHRKKEKRKHIIDGKGNISRIKKN